MKDKLYRFAYRLLKDEDEALDAVQETMVKAWINQRTLLEADSKEAWCMRVVKNDALDRLKRRKKRVIEGIENNYQLKDEKLKNPFEMAAAEDDKKNIANFIAMLPFKQQQVIHLREIEGYSYQEISQITELDINQVKINLYRARRALREKILNTHAYGL